jgi:hypothetical protein
MILGQALVAHICNPSYSGCRDQENQGSKPPQAQKKGAGGVAEGVVPEFKLHYHKKKPTRIFYNHN